MLAIPTPSNRLKTMVCTYRSKVVRPLLASLAGLVLIANPVAGSALAATGTSSGNPSEEAEIAHALDLRRAGKDGDALTELQQVHRRTHSVKSLAQVGLAEQALGRWLDAETHLDEALSSQDPWVKRNLKTLEEAQAFVKSHIGNLEILGSPQDAEVFGEGRLLGRIPMPKPIRVPAGVLSVQMKAPGYLPAVRTLTIVAGNLTRETIELQPSAVDTTSSLRAGPQPNRDGEPPVQTGSDMVGERTSYLRPAAFATGGAAVLAAGVGVVGWVLYQQKASDFRSHKCTNDGSAVSGPDVGLCTDLANSRRTAGVTAIVGLSAAGALAITSTLLFIASSSQNAANVAAAAPRISLSLEPNGARAALSFVF